jgi:putative PEP-CTERM system TPR-repeat lipoprotein
MARRQTGPAQLSTRFALALLTAPVIAPCAASEFAAIQGPPASYRLRMSSAALVTPRQSSAPAAAIVSGWQTVGVIAPDVGVGTRLSGPAGAPDAPSLDPSQSLGQSVLGEGGQPAQQVMQLLGKKQFDQALAASNDLIRTTPKSPVGYNLQGASYLGKQDLAKARASFEQAVRLQADYMPALINLAQLDTRERKLPAARSRYKAILASNAKNTTAMLGMAQVEAVDGKEAAARDWLERAKREQPAAVAPRVLLAYLDIRARAYANAVTELKAARDVAPQSADVLQLLGFAQAAAGANTDAVETYKAVVALRPKSPYAYLQLADAHARAGSVNSAEAALKQALQINPNYIDATIALTYLQLRASRYTEATQLAEKLRKTSPAAAAGLDGDILAHQQRYREASVAYAKALSLAPASALLRMKLHFAQTHAGNAKQADEDVERWIREHPRDVVIRRYLADEYMKAGRSREATQQYEVIVEIEPRNVEALNNLAMLYQSAKDPRSLAVAEKAYQIAPASSVVVDTLGWVLVNRGDVGRGLPLLQKAAASEPKNPEMQYHVAVGLAGAGQPKEARRTLEALLANPADFPQRTDAQALLKTL